MGEVRMITDAYTCVSCGWCAEECPDECIEECADCNPPCYLAHADCCCGSTCNQDCDMCPVDAIRFKDC